MEQLSWPMLSLYAATYEPSFMSSIRKYSAGVQFELSPHPNWTLEDMGYTAMKMRGLERTYFNRASIDAAMKKASGRTRNDITSVAFSFAGEAKRGESQGHCMQTGVFSFGKKKVPTLDLFYRSTEVTKKFGADLLFLRDVVIPYMNTPAVMGKDIQVIRFNFAQCYFSLHFFPILEAYGHGFAIGFLESLRVKNLKYWYQGVQRLPWFFDDRFISKMSMIRAVHEYVVERPLLRKQLEKYYDANVSRLPGSLKRSPPRP